VSASPACCGTRGLRDLAPDRAALAGLGGEDRHDFRLHLHFVFEAKTEQIFEMAGRAYDGVFIDIGTRD
jgi:hypothetical protein